MYTCAHNVHICTHTCKHKSNTHRHAHTMYTCALTHANRHHIYTHRHTRTDTLTGRTTFKRHFSPVGSGWGSDSGHWAFASIEWAMPLALDNQFPILLCCLSLQDILLRSILRMLEAKSLHFSLLRNAPVSPLFLKDIFSGYIWIRRYLIFSPSLWKTFLLLSSSCDR